MGLATLDDLTPTTAHAIEARHLALNPRIRHKHAKLEDEREARHAIVDAARMKLQALREELVTKRRRLADAIANATPPWSHGESQPGSGAGVVVTTGGFPDRAVREAEVARLAENLQHAEGAYTAAQARWATVARLVENCREWLAATPLNRVVVVPVPYERLADPRGELAAMREQLSALVQSADAIARAPVPKAEALARLDAARARVAERVAERRARAIPAFFAPEATLDVGRFGVTDGFGTVGREIEQAIRDLAEERFLADVADWRKAIEAHPVNGKAVPSADRGKRLAAITRKRHELEQREEAIVLSAERDGLDLDRRADASPAAVVCTVLAEDAA